MGVLSNEEYKIIIQNYLKTTEFELVECVTKVLTGSYECFSGMTTEISLTVKQLEKNQLISLAFFLKQYPKGNDYHEDFIKVTRIFFKETQIYNRLLNKLNEEIKGKGKIFAKCYFTRQDDILVLEDLGACGFKKKNLYETLDISECEITLSSLAKLHTASIIYEETHETKLIQLFPDVLFEPLFVTDPDHPGFHHLCVGINAVEAVMEAYFPHVTPEICEKIYNLMRSIPEKMKPSRKYRNVLNHGNLWANNIMMSYNYEGKVEEARMIDFKFSRYCPPTYDVLLFLHLTTSQGLREIDTESLLIYYYNKLGRELAEADIDVHSIMKWDEFKQSIDEEMPLVLAVTVFYLQFYLLPNDKLQAIIKSPEKYEEFIKEDRSQLVLDIMRTEEHYRKRITQSITDLIDYMKQHNK